MRESVKVRDTLPFTEYSPESALRHPRKILTEMFRDLRASRELAWRLTVRDISAQYRQTALGYLWAILPPLATSLVFILLNASQVLNVGETGIPYPAFVMMGTVFWQLFVDALNSPLKVVSASKAMLSKINFPREALIISGILQVLFKFVIQLVLLVAVLIIFKVPIHWTTVFVPIPWLGLLGLGTMFGVLLVPVGLLYEDFKHVLMVGTPLLMFLTPVVYPPPERGLLETITTFNPVTPLLMATREVVLFGIPQNLASFTIVFFGTCLLLFLGWIMYRVAMPILVERMSA